ESMEVTERLEDMRYVRNIERERGAQATITDAVPKASSPQTEEEYYSPALQDTSNKVVTSSYLRTMPSSTTPKSNTKPSVVYASGLSEEQTQAIKDKILKTEISDNYKRVNLILGHTLYAAVSKTANVFGKDVEETEWEPLKKVPKAMIELDNHLLRIYFDDKKGIVEAVEVLANLESSNKSELEKKTSSVSVSQPSVTNKTIDFKSMTVKDLKAYAEEENIELQSNSRKAEIIEILEKFTAKKQRRNLPEIPKSD
ncbi:MAG: Rho termination factor N-terminal domain-containing protein, partial [Promethearchaeota archaeon]